MIPLRLTISGIYSYREEQPIDFQALSANHLFGIFGSVGSGKSAILEAIIYALYGQAERLNNKVSYNLMNLRSNELLISFDFMAAGETGTYRVVVRNKRSKSKFEEIKPQRSLYRMEGNEMTPLDVSQLERIIGINYENFRRTIIIPQGKFQEFLQLSPTARSEMLKELFNLHKYDLSARTGSLLKKNDELMNNCLGRLQQLGEISEEQVVIKQEELKLLERDLAVLREQISISTLREASMQQLSSSFKELSGYKESYIALLKQQDEINLLSQQLSDYEDCTEQFKGSIDLLNDRNQQLNENGKLLEQKQAELFLARQQLAQAELRFNNARTAYEARETIRQQAIELDRCAQINAFHKSASDLETRIAKGTESVAQVNLLITQYKTSINELNEKTGRLKEQLPDIQNLQKAKDWYSSGDILQEKVSALKQQSDSLFADIGKLKETCMLISDQYHIGQSDVENDLSLLPSLLETMADEAGKLLAEAQDLLLKLEVQDKLRSFASELEEGRPCPLCGSVEHPVILTVEHVEENIKIHRKKKDEFQATVHACKGSAIQARGFIGQINAKQNDLDRITELTALAESNLVDHLASNQWPDLNREKVNELWDNYDKLQKQIELNETESKKAALEIEKAEVNEKKYSFSLEGLRAEYLAANKNADLLISQLELLDYNQYVEVPAQTLKAEAENLKARYTRINDEYKLAEHQFMVISSNVQGLASSVSTLAEALESLKSSTEGLNAQLEERISASKYRTIDHVQDILSQNIDRTMLRQYIQAYQQNRSGIESSIHNLEKQLEGKTYDASEHEILISELKMQAKQQEIKNREKGALEKEIQTLDKALADSLVLKTELKYLEARRENIRILAELFRGQGFVNYVSTIYLQNLVRAANERFHRLTRQQLKLELDEENNFRVRDYLNSGRWRSVKTLSGGQTFQASLCLALALADSLQQLNQKGQNFFFLDEGFGSLDKEALEMVFDTLKSLRKENRIVGIISHVEDMQQEVTSWLRITRDEERGSLIETSYQS